MCHQISEKQYSRLNQVPPFISRPVITCKSPLTSQQFSCLRKLGWNWQLLKHCCNLLPIFDDLLPYHATTVLALDQVPAWALVSALYRGMVVFYIIFNLLLWIVMLLILLRQNILTRNDYKRNYEAQFFKNEYSCWMFYSNI